MEKTIKIDDRDVTFKATASTPRLYRIKFRRDLLQDMAMLAKASNKTEFDVPDLELFENVAYIMAKQADNSIADDIFDWLDNFDTFAIRDILPAIMELWGANMETQIQSKKKKIAVVGN